MQPFLSSESGFRQLSGLCLLAGVNCILKCFLVDDVQTYTSQEGQPLEKVCLSEPQKRYLRAFWRKFSVITTLNSIFFIIFPLHFTLKPNFFLQEFFLQSRLVRVFFEHFGLHELFFVFSPPPYHFSNGPSLSAITPNRRKIKRKGFYKGH